MEAEYNALAMAMRDVLLLQTLFKQIGHGIGLDDFVTSHFKTTVWEDKKANLEEAAKDPTIHALKYNKGVKAPTRTPLLTSIDTPNSFAYFSPPGDFVSTSTCGSLIGTEHVFRTLEAYMESMVENIKQESHSRLFKAGVRN